MPAPTLHRANRRITGGRRGGNHMKPAADTHQERGMIYGTYERRAGNTRKF
jgi:hypothetical protein